jgi:two-component system, OmpR family, phosphate regulon response regulator PhoB
MAKKILIVEDDTFLQGLTATKLASSGYEIMTASNSDEVTKILEDKTPDFILLDLVLPGTDGYGILKKIRENLKTREVPVFIFSNLAEDKDITKAKELGANEFLIKSNFTLDELSEKIKTILG